VSDTNEILLKAEAQFARKVSKTTEGKAWFICPFHLNGKEKTPSLSLTVKGKYSGSYNCFACGAKGSVFKSSDNRDNIFYTDFDDSIIKEDSNDLEVQFNALDLWPNEAWRTIPYKTMKRLKARIRYEEYPKAVLPVIQNEKLRGTISCSLYKSKIAYIYSKGNWIKKTLFPYDYTKRILKKHKLSTLFLVEGPRDAAKLIQYNIPALANLGGVTVFSKDKVDLINQLDVPRIVLAFDPDEIGIELTQLYKKALFGHKIGYLILRKTKTFKEDPASLSEVKLQSLANTFGY
jgi:5S rRNA maturation endonuclease (ribonuclease M5)